MPTEPEFSKLSSAGGIVGSVVLRLLASLVAVVVAFALALLSAVPYGGGSKELIFMAAFVLVFCIGWSLLPIFRAARSLKIAISLTWLAFGAGLGVLSSPAGNWLLGPWGLATAALAVLEFWQSQATDGKSQTAKHE